MRIPGYDPACTHLGDPTTGPASLRSQMSLPHCQGLAKLKACVRHARARKGGANSRRRRLCCTRFLSASGFCGGKDPNCDCRCCPSLLGEGEVDALRSGRILQPTDKASSPPRCTEDQLFIDLSTVDRRLNDKNAASCGGSRSKLDLNFVWYARSADVVTVKDRKAGGSEAKHAPHSVVTWEDRDFAFSRQREPSGGATTTTPRKRCRH
mmetsp:Transcript_8838/g.17966  ORF Transcript_8838/g.17966 Transcript_8838/m.17966 type:complete len:209 (+) Transcript_8838:376-1002(+)